MGCSIVEAELVRAGHFARLAKMSVLPAQIQNARNPYKHGIPAALVIC